MTSEGTMHYTLCAMEVKTCRYDKKLKGHDKFGPAKHIFKMFMKFCKTEQNSLCEK